MTSIVRNGAAGSSNTAVTTYTNSFIDKGTAAVTATQIVAPASNVNGIYVEYIGFSGAHNGTVNSATNVSIIAKSSAPASDTDGDVIFRGTTGMGSSSSNAIAPVLVQQWGRIKIPAGKGLYLNQTVPAGTAAGVCDKTVLYTIL